MEKLIRTLQFLRVIDDQKNMSLTNIALMGALGRVLMMPDLDTTTLLTFVATLIGYQARRLASGLAGGAAKTDETADLRAMIKSLQTKTTALEMGQRTPRL